MNSSGYFYIKNGFDLEINENCVNDTVKDLIYGLLFRSVNVNLIKIKGFVAKTKNAVKTDVPTVTENGVYICGKNEKEVIDALFRILVKAEPVDFGADEKIVGLPVGEYTINPKAETVMLHLCVFPETDLTDLKKTIRVAGISGYTHVIIESWGGMEFDCMKELGWKDFAYSKEQMATVIKEIRDLKMEPVPMVNCLGHASLGRVEIGKHVVLDQNIRLSDYFLKYGWVWNFKKQKVKDLLKAMRREMCELCGEGQYFHIGLDETYYNPKDDSEKDKIYAYITEICETVKNEGRTPILWGDMFLNSEELSAPLTSYSCHAYTPVTAKKMLDAVPDYAIIADWHYRVKEYPWKTSAYIAGKGYKTIQCCWYDFKNDESAVETSKSLGTLGVMLTTWHGLPLECKGIESVVRTGLAAMGEEPPFWTDGMLLAADLWRKVMDDGVGYERAGFTKSQITEYTDVHVLD